MKIGNLEIILLNILNKKPLSGYYLMKEIQNHTGWKPSTGSIYPLLIRWQNEGLLKVKKHKRSKIYHLTDKGNAYLLKLNTKKHELLNKLVTQIDICSLILSKNEMKLFINGLIKRLGRNENNN